ncbi:melanopsin-like [Dendronephthya gigantea]|uniref:melanopsin-like n=1 Tax=Dendronephthya gigantea TaxID=151771 RepID=UPI00106A21BC|nr:melanopsin-like [Dendronephthya gigantea]
MPVTATDSGVITSFFCFIIIFGTFSNGLVVLTYIKWRKTMLWKPKDLLILSLAFGDFVTCLFVCPLVLSSAISRTWLWGYPGCVFYAFITAWVGLASMMQLAILSIERYITLRSSNLHVVSKRQIILAILACWLFTFIICCLPLTGWSEYTFEALGLHCSMNWEKKSVSNLTFCLFLLIVFFFMPICAIVGSYLKVFFVVRRIYKNAIEMWGPEAQATKQSYVSQVKSAKNLLLVISAFILAWSPYAIMCVMILLFDLAIPLRTRQYPSMFAKTALISNPIIYFFGYRKLRRRALAMLGIQSCKC